MNEGAATMTAIAIIGQGYMGRTHAEAWSNLGYGDQIKYVCTPRPGQPLEHAPRAEFVTDLDVVLADRDVDILSVCTPTPTHADIAIQALRAGKNVLLEKPIALTVADGLAIQAAAVESGRILMIAQVVRFFEGYRLLREDAQAGALGSILSARARRIMNKPNWAPWMDDESQSGGVVVDVSIHDFDQMNLFLGEPVAVTCRSQARLGPFETTIEYRNGGIGQVLSFANTPQGVPFTSSIELLGSKGFAEYQFSDCSPTEQSGSGNPLSGANTYRLAAAHSTVSAIVDDEPYTRQAEYFLRSVKEVQQPESCTTASAIQALEVSLAAKQSLKTGDRVQLDSQVPDANSRLLQ